MIYVDKQARLSADTPEQLRAFLRRLRISSKHIGPDGTVALTGTKLYFALDLGAVPR